MRRHELRLTATEDMNENRFRAAVNMQLRLSEGGKQSQAGNDVEKQCAAKNRKTSSIKSTT